MYIKYIRHSLNAIRNIWKIHPIKLDLKRDVRQKIDGRFHCPCAMCGQWFLQDDIEVDHLADRLPFTSLSHFGPYVDRLFNVTKDDLQLVCSKCHKIKTYAETMNMTIEEATIMKKVIIMANNAKVARKWAQEYQIPYKNLKQFRVDIKEALENEQRQNDNT